MRLNPVIDTIKNIIMDGVTGKISEKLGLYQKPYVLKGGNLIDRGSRFACFLVGSTVYQGMQTHQI
jgi:hypothetical protein